MFTIGTGVAAGLLGTDATATRGRQSEYALVQGDDFEVVVRPAFSDAAALHDEHYEWTLTGWEFPSASEDAVERISLRMTQP